MSPLRLLDRGSQLPVVRQVSGAGRTIADDIEAEQQLRRKGHRTRWQARIEGRDGRTLAKVESRGRRMAHQRDEAIREDADLRRLGLRVR